MKIWILVLCLIIGVCGVGMYENTYILEDCVVSDVCGSSALIQDKNGNLWEVQDVNLWEHQVVNLVMNNNRTSIVEDDIVKRVD